MREAGAGREGRASGTFPKSVCSENPLGYICLYTPSPRPPPPPVSISPTTVPAFLTLLEGRKLVGPSQKRSPSGKSPSAGGLGKAEFSKHGWEPSWSLCQLCPDTSRCNPRMFMALHLYPGVPHQEPPSSRPDCTTARVQVFGEQAQSVLPGF